jgi:hypothetical protein
MMMMMMMMVMGDDCGGGDRDGDFWKKKRILKAKTMIM